MYDSLMERKKRNDKRQLAQKTACEGPECACFACYWGFDSSFSEE